MRLMIGAAREKITPKPGVLLAGYGSPNPAVSVNDDLAVNAVAVEYGTTKFMLVSVDVCLIGNELCAGLRELCGKAAGIPASNVTVCSTHTHSGPITSDSASEADEGGYFSEVFKPGCAKAAQAASANIKPVKLGVAARQSRIGINRRRILRDDTVELGHNPWAPYDPELTVISFKGEDGKPVLNIVHYAAHNTAAGIVTTISRDWCGYMVDRLEAESGAISVYFNGCAGDVAPRIVKGESTGGGDIKYAAEHGALAGYDAVRAYKDIREYRDAPAETAYGEIRIPYDPIKPLELARRQYAEVEHGEGRFDAGYRKLLSQVLEMHANGNTGPADFIINQTIMRIGPVVFIPIPFEPFSEISMRLRAYSRFGYTLALGYANGSNSYLPTQDQLCRGGYEVERFLWASPRQLPANTDVQLINANLQIMDKLAI